MWKDLVKADCLLALKDQCSQPCWGIQSAMFGNQKSSAHCAGQFSFHRVQNMSMGIRTAKLPTLFLYWVIPLGTHTVGPLPGAIKESLHIPAHHLDTEDFVIVLVSIFPSLGNVHLHALWHSGIWKAYPRRPSDSPKMQKIAPVGPLSKAGKLDCHGDTPLSLPLWFPLSSSPSQSKYRPIPSRQKTYLSSLLITK